MPIVENPIVTRALSDMGLPGAIIFVLLAVIVLLAGANTLQWRHANKVYGFRLAERDTLRDALNESRNTLKEVLEGMLERNEITEELSQVIREHTTAFKSLQDVITIHYAGMKDDNDRVEQVVTAISESMRALALATTDMRSQVALAAQQTDASLKLHFAQIGALVATLGQQNNTPAPRRRGE